MSKEDEETWSIKKDIRRIKMSEIHKTTLIRLGDLKLVDYNPRKVDKKVTEKIKKSIQEFGFCQPLVVNKNLNIIGGNQRYVALMELHGPEKEVTVVMLELTKEKEMALNVALNKISGEWEFDKLTSLLTSLDSINLSDLTGFDRTELNILDIGVTIPEVQIMPSSKTLRYPLIFYFDDIMDKIFAEKFFSNKKLGWQGKELNSLLLKKLIEKNERTNGTKKDKKDTTD